MNKKKLTLPMLAACLLLATYSLPAAVGGGVYLAADVGRSQFNGDIFDGIPGGTTSINNTASAYRVTGGYQFSPYWGLEIGSYKSRAHRDRVNAKLMKDPRLAEMMDPKKSPFDGKRMFWGGFKPLVSL